MDLRAEMMRLLSQEAELEEIVKLVGMDALSPGDRLTMEAARSIREDFLHQLAFHEVDTYTSLHKQLLMMRLVIAYYNKGAEALEDGGDIEKIVNLPVREEIGRFKYVAEDETDAEYDEVLAHLNAQLEDAKKGEDD